MAEAGGKSLASTATEAQRMAALDTKLQMASAESWDETQATGVGGPIETADAGTLDLAPQPAATNYPPCSPGPGDDRCIQLYEPGVRDQLASWNRPTGGLLDDRNATAMGGPYEPASVDMTGKPAEANLASVYKPEADATAAVGGPYEPADIAEAKPAQADLASVYKADAGASAGMGGPYEPVETELAMNGDGSVDASVGETTHTELAASTGAGTAVADHGAFTGVGGPIEAQSGYPPCSPGPGDDRCIQLYESGVSGAGN